MNWVIYALITTLFYSFFDFLIKLASDKIHSGFGSFIVNAVSTLVLIVYLIYVSLQGEKIFSVKPGGIFFSVMAGIAIGIASIFFLKMFAVGTNLSIGVPLVRIGMVVLGSLLGVFILKEGITLRYGIGFGLSIIGLYLILTAK